MSLVDDALAYNKKFVKDEQYAHYKTTKFPNKKIAILTCMDTRLTELLLASLGFKNGDIKVIKNAGAVISHPFGSVMRSLLIAVYELAVEEIMVIGHYDCGVQGIDPKAFIRKMLDRGIEQEKIDMIEFCGVDLNTWLRGFDCVETSVMETVNIIRSHPLVPKGVKIYGFVIDPNTGKLDTL